MASRRDFLGAVVAALRYLGTGDRQAHAVEPDPWPMICRGTEVLLELADGREVEPPASHGLLHDPSGRHWPKRSLLVGPFRKGPAADPEKVPSEARSYLGRTHTVHVGEARVEALPRRLESWTKLGELATLRTEQGVIFYRRGGTKAPGRFRHQFNRAGLSRLFRGKGKVTVYRRGEWLRIELPRNAQLDERGIVAP